MNKCINEAPDLDVKREHVYRCLQVLEDVFEGLTIPRRLKETILNHDIGYSPNVSYEGCTDHNINGYLATKKNIMISSIAILLHGKLDKVDLETTDVTLLETYLIDYCDILSGPNGEEFTIEQRYSDIESRYGAESFVYKEMARRKDYYIKIISNIGNIVGSYQCLRNY